MGDQPLWKSRETDGICRRADHRAFDGGVSMSRCPRHREALFKYISSVRIRPEMRENVSHLVCKIEFGLKSARISATRFLQLGRLRSLIEDLLNTHEIPLEYGSQCPPRSAQLRTEKSRKIVNYECIMIQDDNLEIGYAESTREARPVVP